MCAKKTTTGVILNAYPDSVMNNLKGMLSVLRYKELKDVFDTFYILPSIFNTDLDRGFSVIDYEINTLYASNEDLEKIKKIGINLKLDIILNHASVLSPQFLDLVKKGKKSRYYDFFINWNDFWKNEGIMTKEGYIKPHKKHLSKMFFRKPDLPFLMVRFPDGTDVPYWNTFYQQVQYKSLDVHELITECNLQYSVAFRLCEIVNPQLSVEKKIVDIDFEELLDYKRIVIEFMESKKMYLGQMDLNIKSKKVWDFYDKTLEKLASYGAQIIRLDAFAYSSKVIGKPNFLNNPETWNILGKVKKLADKYHITLLPEIHSTYKEKIHETLNEKKYMTYDFFLPGLIIDAIENNTTEYICAWAKEIYENNMFPVNMLGCHDGIPLLDLKGLLDEQRIQKLIDTIVSRGGYVKNLHGQKNMYYQVNATYYSALGEDDDKMVLARAIQLFMPGIPQIWYLDLFAGKNDHEAVKKGGVGGHKEINRTNLSKQDIDKALKKRVVKKQLDLLRFRNTHKAFSRDAKVTSYTKGKNLILEWKNKDTYAILRANVETKKFSIDFN